MIKRNMLSNTQVIQFYKFLSDNAADLKGQTLEDVAAKAETALGFPIKATNVKKMNIDFNLGLGVRIVKKGNATRAEFEEYKTITDKTILILAGEMALICKEIKMAIPLNVRAVLKKFETLAKTTE